MRSSERLFSVSLHTNNEWFQCQLTVRSSNSSSQKQNNSTTDAMNSDPAGWEKQRVRLVWECDFPPSHQRREGGKMKCEKVWKGKCQKPKPTTCNFTVPVTHVIIFLGNSWRAAELTPCRPQAALKLDDLVRRTSTYQKRTHHVGQHLFH
jgi:hypothetical protein